MAEYFASIFLTESRKDVISRALQALGNVDFDTICVRGMSGAMVGPILAHELGKDLILIRKHGDRCHYSAPIYKHPESKAHRYVIVDDFIRTGTTVKEMLMVIHSELPSLELAGFYGYTMGWQNDLRDYPPDWFVSMAQRSMCCKFILPNGRVHNVIKEVEERERKEKERRAFLSEQAAYILEPHKSDDFRILPKSSRSHGSDRIKITGVIHDEICMELK